MQHRKLDALMSSIEKIARVAAAGVEQARAVQTEPSGAKSYDNADGTRTIIGNIANGESNPSYTMATHVGDVTAPGTPTGVTASSKSGVVVVEWDGTLSGGIPDDFFCVRIYLDGAELGVLREAGSVSSAKLEGGTTHSVTATAEDDACLPDGTPAHNVSAPTAAVSVTVSEGVESVAAIAQQALDVANATGQYFWHNTGEETDPIEADVSGGTGAHVTQFKREEWSDPTHENYHKGPNSLWNSLGMLFRNGLNNLLANLAGSVKTVTLTAEESYQFSYDLPDTASSVLSVTFAGAPVSSFSLEYNDDGTSRVLTSGEPYAQEGDAVVITYRVSPALTVFDGEGNSASDIVANFTAGCIDLGKNTASAIIRLIDGLGIIKADANGLRIESPSGTTIFAGDTEGQFARIGGSVGAGAGAGMALYNPASPNGGINIDFTCAGTGNTVYMASSGTAVTVTMLEFINSIRTAQTTMVLSNVGSGTHTLYLYRQGRFVFASMANAINPASANTAINAGTIPSGYRPAYTAFCSGNGMVSNTIGGWYYRWRVATGGQITLHISVTGSREAPISMCWFTNDSWPA